MMDLLCTWKGKSDWLQPGEWYVSVGENFNGTSYLIDREGFPNGKSYSKKHFLGVPVVNLPEIVPDVPDYLSEFDV
jgi:hypothetical protein